MPDVSVLKDQERGQAEMTRGVNEVLEDIKDMQLCGHSMMRAVEILKVAELRKITRELESIETALQGLQQSGDALGECIAKSPKGSFFCITGDVTNYEG